MYQNFYHLKKKPFHITPDPEFLFLSPSHKEALGSIIYGVKNRKGFVVITGEVGAGKTTILRSYLEKVDRPKVRIVYLFNSNVSFQNLLRTIYKELGIEAKTDDIVEMLKGLYQILMEEYKQGNTVLLIVDEAQNMPVATLENLRMLSNLETSKEKLLQIVLVGQQEFEQILGLHQLRQLKQRIAIRSTIIPLTRQESMAYIRHRLGKAAMNGSEVFTQGAVKRIVKEAKGIPRTLNILSDNVLITGYGYKVKPVDAKIVKEVVSDFYGEKPSIWKWAIPKPSLPKWVVPILSSWKSIVPMLSLWKWLVPTMALLVLLVVGLVLIYPYLSSYQDKGQVLSKIENPAPPKTEALNPTEEEIKPPIEKQEVSQTDQSAQVKEEMKPQQDIKSPEEKPAPEQAKAASPVIKVVKEGDNLYKLTRSVYGHADPELVAWVKKNNPSIKDMNTLLVGAKIIFPEAREDEVKAKNKD